MVLGLKSLNRKLTQTIPERVRIRTRAAMEKGADEIVAMAKSLVPVDSGDLRDSIGWTWADAPKGSIVLASSAPDRGGERITIYAGNDEAYYARWVEFGTQKNLPSPFFFPSYRALKRRVKGRITREMRKAIKEGSK
ncbi:HK97 family phage protein [Nitratireductor indicus C115]|uniref:HK97 family phage protein n=1 Tax=Nitratireductor indicus C115 TaxID=1231190 RepID=K2NPX8_9HYPH|nr:HK97-gp10 family putative phage morphogenesis protein [Nitratireductor indicus]EKF39914.1 HK97 family phage protein [Nitratireductor indicus C115]SFQ81882.1 phage protein, HK97 gp10 family [Nitratireductor indicus]